MGAIGKLIQEMDNEFQMPIDQVHADRAAGAAAADEMVKTMDEHIDYHHFLCGFLRFWEAIHVLLEQRDYFWTAVKLLVLNSFPHLFIRALPTAYPALQDFIGAEGVENNLVALWAARAALGRLHRGDKTFAARI